MKIVLSIVWIIIVLFNQNHAQLSLDSKKLIKINQNYHSLTKSKSYDNKFMDSYNPIYIKKVFFKIDDEDTIYEIIVCTPLTHKQIIELDKLNLFWAPFYDFYGRNRKFVRFKCFDNERKNIENILNSVY